MCDSLIKHFRRYKHVSSEGKQIIGCWEWGKGERYSKEEKEALEGDGLTALVAVINSLRHITQNLPNCNFNHGAVY